MDIRAGQDWVVINGLPVKSKPDRTGKKKGVRLHGIDGPGIAGSTWNGENRPSCTQPGVLASGAAVAPVPIPTQKVPQESDGCFRPAWQIRSQSQCSGQRSQRREGEKTRFPGASRAGNGIRYSRYPCKTKVAGSAHCIAPRFGFNCSIFSGMNECTSAAALNAGIEIRRTRNATRYPGFSKRPVGTQP